MVSLLGHKLAQKGGAWNKFISIALEEMTRWLNTRTISKITVGAKTLSFEKNLLE